MSQIEGPIGNEINAALNAFHERKYRDAARSFYSLATKSRDLDLIIHYQMRVCGSIAEMADQPTEEPNAIRHQKALLLEAIDQTQNIDDRVSLVFNPMLRYFDLLLHIACDNVNYVRNYYADQLTGCDKVNGPLQILECMSAAIYLLDHDLSHAAIKDVLELIATIKSCTEKCIKHKSNNTAVSEVLKVVHRCVLEVGQVVETERRTRPLCLAKANALRKKYAALSCVHKLLETIVPNYTETRNNKEVVMKVTINNPKGAITIAENIHGDLTTYDQTLLLPFEKVEHALMLDSSAKIPYVELQAIDKMIESKKITELEFAAKFPFLSAKWKRTIEKKGETPDSKNSGSSAF